MKRIFILIAAALLATGVQAQSNQHSNYIGLNVGAGMNTLLYTPDSGSFRPGLGGQVGLQYMHFFGKHFGFGIGAQYGVHHAYAKYNVTLQGSTLVSHPSNNWNYYPVNVYDKLTERQMVSTVSVPVELYFRAPMGDKWAFLLGLGAQFDKTLGGKYAVTDGAYETQGYFPATNVTYRNLPDYGFRVYNDRPEGKVEDIKSWGLSVIADLGFNVALGEHWGLYMGIYGGYGISNLYDTVNSGNALLTIDPNDVTKIDYNSTIASSRIDAFRLLSAGVKLGINFGWDCHGSNSGKGSKGDDQLVSYYDNDGNNAGDNGKNGKNKNKKDKKDKDGNDDNNAGNNNGGNNPAGGQNYGNDGAEDAEAAAAAEARCNARRMNDADLQQALKAIDNDLAEAEAAAQRSGDPDAQAKVADARAKANDARNAIKNGKYCRAYDMMCDAYGNIADSYAADARAAAAKANCEGAQKGAEDAALYADAAHKCELDCAMASTRNAKINADIAACEGAANKPADNYNDRGTAEYLSQQALNMANEVGSKPGVTNAKDASGKAYRGNMPESYAASAKSFANSAATCAMKTKNADALAAAAEAQRYAEEAAEAARMGNTAAAYRAAINAREAAYRACNMANSEPTDTKPATSKEDAKKQLANIGATVNFDFNATDPKFDAKTDKAINTICSAMAADKSIKIVITGHTDNIGSDEINMKFGKRRAEMLKDLMVKRGAPAANISTESKGESEPIVPNDTDEHRYQNRRAVITLK